MVRKIARKNVNGPTPYGSDVDRVILDYYLRIGDRVEMAVQDSDEGWSKRAVVNGIQGTCIGFNRYTTYHARIGSRNEPGEYRCNGSAIIRWDNGKFDNPSMHDIVFVDESLRADGKRNRPDFEAYRDAFQIEEFIAPLPDLPFWEWDVVQAVGEDLFGPDTELRVTRINYSYLGETRVDGSPMPLFEVETLAGNSGYIAVNPDRIKLVRRGAIWKHFNEPQSLTFDTLEDEIKFNLAMSFYAEVRNPKTGNYHWPKEDVLEGAKVGVIDLVATGGVFFSVVSARGLKLTNPDLAKRCNAKLIEGFTNDA